MTNVCAATDVAIRLVGRVLAWSGAFWLLTRATPFIPFKPTKHKATDSRLTPHTETQHLTDPQNQHKHINNTRNKKGQGVVRGYRVTMFCSV